jgi:hypothetical protein
VKKASLRESISELYIRQTLLDFGFRREGSRPGSLNLRFAPRILYGEGLGKDWSIVIMKAPRHRLSVC